MEKKLYLATVIAVIAAIGLVLFSGSSYFSDTETSIYNTFTASTTDCCSCTLEVNKSTTTYINYYCDVGCTCGELDEVCLENCIELLPGGIAVGRVADCLNECGTFEPTIKPCNIAPGKIDDNDTFVYRCCEKWGGEK